MQHNEKLMEALSDLVKINIDRIEGYRKAMDQTDDVDLKALFQRMTEESNVYINQLNEEILKGGSGQERNTTVYGRLYRTWIGVRATFTGKNRYAILAACEYGEDAAQKTYEDALRSDISMPYSVREMIANQKNALKSSHDTVKTYRDLEKVVQH